MSTSDDELRMNAYYYSFEPTRVRPVDVLLSAVASAGKAYHHTDCWTDEDGIEPTRYGPFRGSCPRDWIQAAAEDAAAAISDAEARGYARCQADVVAYLRSTTNGTRACREWVAFDVERGAHEVKRAEDSSQSRGED